MAFGTNDEIIFGHDDEVIGVSDKAYFEKAPPWAKMLFGAPEAAIGMVTGLPSQIAGGLSGLGKLATGSSIEDAGKAVEDIQRWNFGAGEYMPYTDVGKYAYEKVGKAFAAPGEKAGDVGAYIGKKLGNEELGRLSLKLPTDVFMNFLPIGATVGIGKGMVDSAVSKIKKKAEPAPSKWEKVSEKPFGENDVVLPDIDPGLLKGIDNAQVARLEQALAKRNQPNPAMHIDSEGRLYTPEQVAELSKASEEFSQVSREQTAQKTLDQRQQLLEQDVARQQVLDFNAAERSRQEQAPTNYPAWVEQMQKQERIPGNNEALSFEHSTQPFGLKESPEIVPGLDMSQFNAERLSAPLEKQLQENRAWEQRSTEQLVEDTAARIAEETSMKLEEQLRPLEEQLRASAHVPTYDGQGPKTRAAKAAQTRGQRGGIDYTEVSKAIKGILSSMDNYTAKIAPISMSRTIVPDNADFARQIPGMEKVVKSVILRPESAETLLQKAKTEADLPSNWNNLAMGPEMVGEKNGNSLVSGVSKWLQWQNKKADLAKRELVEPVKKTISKLSPTELVDLAEGLKREMFRKEKFSDAELSEVLSPRMVEAYKQLRNSFDTVYEMQAKNLAEQGKEVPTKQEAYLASMRNGNYHVSVVDSSGRPIWHIQENNALSARKAVKWLQENVPAAKNAKWEYRANNNVQNIPKDVLGAFQEAVKLLDDDSVGAQAIKRAIEEAQDRAGYTHRGQHFRFMDKQNVRGFEGDKPWLSPKENAVALLKNQVDYVNNAYSWSYMQQALGEVKKILSDPEIIQKQPNTIEYVKEVVRQQIGMGDALVKQAEERVMHQLGMSRTLLNKAVGKANHWTSLLQLGGSVGYMIATPLTAAYSVALHAREGILNAKSLSKGLADGSAAVVNQLLYENGKQQRMPMTELGREALKYAEDNGIATKGMFNDFDQIGGNTAAGNALKYFESTITVPEKYQRLFTFMSFVHALDQSKKYSNVFDLYKRAETLTNIAATNFRPSELPLGVQKLGNVGGAMFKYKAPILNYYNQLHMMSRDAIKGNVKPLTALLGMTAILGGVQNLPGVNELDSVMNLFNKLHANVSPSTYNGDISVKGFLQENLPEAVAYGAVQEALGAQMSQRFGTDLANLEDPLGNMMPMASMLKNAGESFGDLAKGQVAPAAWKIAPQIARGNIEVSSDAFKAPNRPGGYVKPSDAGDTAKVQLVRNEHDEFMRRYGLRSANEAKQLEQRARGNKELANVKTASDKLVTNLVNYASRGDGEKASTYAKSWVKLNPDGDFQAALTKELNNSIYTKEEQALIAAKSIRAIQNAQKVQSVRR